MKHILSILAGTALVLAFSLSVGAASAAAANDKGDKTIRDEDLLHQNLDQDRATLNQMPAERGAEGFAAGGERNGDSESSEAGTEQGTTSVDTGQTGPGDEESSTPSMDKGSAGPGTEEPGAGGAGTEPGGYRY